MNALSQHSSEVRIKTIIRAANASKLRYPLLILTLVVLCAVVVVTGHLIEGIFEAWPN